MLQLALGFIRRSENYPGGGDAQVLPTANPDQLLLFKENQIDAVWTVEPWVSRLEMEADGEVLVDDREAITTVLVTRADLLATRQGLVRKLLDAQSELTDWKNTNTATPDQIASAELNEDKQHTFSPELTGKPGAGLW
jgi:NitT/TauT family transport system substrate-binding protein